MPELPEVETIRRGLSRLLTDAVITRLQIHDPRLVRRLLDRSLATVSPGTAVTKVKRRGKYLLLELDDGSTLVHHLRMTGAFHTASEERLGHIRATYHLKDRPAVLYRDVRRFGTLERIPSDELPTWLDARLGPEPLGPEFTTQWLVPHLEKRSAPIKGVLLDQRIFCGVGNIYADEALAKSGINPLEPANSIDADRLHLLIEAVRAVLARGIELQGSTLRDYSMVDGSSGSMQDEFRVYGRAGQQCLACDSTILAVQVAGRTTAYCPSCQTPVNS